MIVCLIVGLEQAGLVGGIVAQGVAFVLAYPVVVWLARRMGAWDPLHDLVYFVLGAAVAGLALWVNWSAVVALA
jgi:DMSO/TMAO reductase YedYZ heme-binding membrane subunit